jgi:hypothetical protein
VIFAVVVEASGFSATRRLKIPISTVGRSGADIENLFGVCLLLAQFASTLLSMQFITE